MVQNLGFCVVWGGMTVCSPAHNRCIHKREGCFKKRPAKQSTVQPKGSKIKSFVSWTMHGVRVVVWNSEKKVTN